MVHPTWCRGKSTSAATPFATRSKRRWATNPLLQSPRRRPYLPYLPNNALRRHARDGRAVLLASQNPRFFFRPDHALGVQSLFRVVGHAVSVWAG